MLNSIDDIITAVATPIGSGALSIIRISGKNCFEIVDKIFSGKEKLHDSSSHRIHYGKIINHDDIVVDDVLVSVFKEPNSYTGEDSIEISAHGNQLITKKIIELLLSLDIRIAEPGEFTKRAFLNGKIDLAQAEAVVDVINSRTEVSLKGARNQLDGLLSKKIDVLRKELISVSSLLELELDFAEEGLEFVSNNRIMDNTYKIINEIENLLKTYSFGKVLRDGVNVALVGKPNVGKSSLLNYLLKESRAIVSHIPGTTRDVIREEISIDGILFILFDTAGIRITEDEIETEGVKRSRAAVGSSDLVILLDDPDTNFSEDLYRDLLGIVDKNKIITVVNKIDLKKGIDSGSDLYISALTGEGIDGLKKELISRVLNSTIFTEQLAIVSNARHYKALQDSKNSLTRAIESIKNCMSEEFIASDLRDAENSLGEIIGVVTTDDILNNIFEKFCVGK
jgi:tRNA modification GTPase